MKHQAEDRQARRRKKRPDYEAAVGKEVNQDGVEVRWEWVDAGLLRHCIDRVTAAGDAVIIGRSRDGGTYAITLLTDGPRVQRYPREVEQLEEVLAAWAAAADAAMEGTVAPIVEAKERARWAGTLKAQEGGS